MDEKDDIIEKQIAAAMIDTTTTTYVNSLSNLVEKLEKRANELEIMNRDLYLKNESLESSIKKLDDEINTKVTRQDLENYMEYTEDKFKGMLTKSMYIVFALFFMVLLIMYFF